MERRDNTDALGFSLFGAVVQAFPVLSGARLVTGQVGLVETALRAYWIVSCSPHVTGCTHFILAVNRGCWEDRRRPSVRRGRVPHPGVRAAAPAPALVWPRGLGGGEVGAVPSASAAPAVTVTCGPRHCCPRTPRTPGAHGPGEDQRQGPRGPLLPLVVHGRPLQPPAGEPGPARAQVRAAGARAAGGALWVGSPPPARRTCERGRLAELPEPSALSSSAFNFPVFRREAAGWCGPSPHHTL